MKTVLIPIPSTDFDPTEVSIPWRMLASANQKVVFATPSGSPAQGDPRMINGTGLGIFGPFLKANKIARAAYQELVVSESFKRPMQWDDLSEDQFDALILPGGHAQGMREYLESSKLQNLTTSFFSKNKPVGAICHGVVLAARSKKLNGKSVLYGRKTTALLAIQELTAWALSYPWLGSYYRTYKQTVEAEVKEQLAHPADFIKGPLPLKRDDLSHLDRGFVANDDNYISARWPGDAHLFATRFLELLS